VEEDLLSSQKKILIYSQYVTNLDTNYSE